MPKIKVKMTPHLDHFRSGGFGVGTVVKKWFEHLPKYGIELVKPDATTYDLDASHAGMKGGETDIAHLHGMYFTADYDAAAWEYEANRRIVEAVRSASAITVPSDWVAEIFQRDMRLTPYVVPHGVDWDEWQHNEENEGYIMGYAKGRVGDVCDPSFLSNLAPRFPKHKFLTTFAPRTNPDNVSVMGTLPQEVFKRILQRSAVYISPAKETFGVLTLEAMASGVPALGWRYGGNASLIQHGISGYLAEPGNYDDLAEGLAYCLKYRDVLGANGRELARAWTWEKAIEKLVKVYQAAMVEEAPGVSVVIPVYKKTAEQITRAIDSCLAQTLQPVKIVVVDDGSDNGVAHQVCSEYKERSVQYIPQNNQGVANARNNGIMLCDTKYIACLDADDYLEPGFLAICVETMEQDRTLGIAYTGLKWHALDGSSGLSDWPGDWDFDKQVNYTARQNQVPTCCVFRRIAWARLGGYRQRYAPGGAGAEDAEFWTRMGAYGFGAKKVTEEPLFNYSLGGSVSSDPDYREPDWLAWHPWSRDGLHPFASYATPRRQSHPVRQYDEPVVSVIIPVGPGHEKELINALDSLEAQTFRKWEAVVVWDGDPDGVYLYNMAKAYPYVKRGGFSHQKGAGFARNKGVSIARAPFVLFLDADDTLHPEAIETMLNAWSDHGAAIYTDYVGQAFISEEYATKLEKENRLRSFNPKDGEAIISYRSFDFDCARALLQPESDKPYIWNLITTLVPKAWHDEIGGFDEAMDTWEDWDYWLRIARAGHCFHRVERELVRYRFYTGKRRELATPDTSEGRHKAQTVLEYLKRKYANSEAVMGCGCGSGGKNGKSGTSAAQVLAAAQVEASNMMNDNDFVRARYTGPRGKHWVIGAKTFEFQPTLPATKVNNNPPQWKIKYGYFDQGHETLVHKDDVKLMVGKWQVSTEKVEAPRVEAVPLGEPVALATVPAGRKVTADTRPTIKPVGRIIEPNSSFDLQTLPGVTPSIARNLEREGLTTPETIREAGYDKLLEIKGIAEARARMILKAVADM